MNLLLNNSNAKEPNAESSPSTDGVLQCVTATAEQRRRGKSMSRRSGQVGTIVKEGGWYRVRFRLDIPGQYERVQKSIKICPVSGPGLLTKSERERRKVEIVNSFGANSVERFSSVVEGESGVTFREQSKVWLVRTNEDPQAQTRETRNHRQLGDGIKQVAAASHW